MADSSLWPGYILHSRPLGEDKLILQLLLSEQGRVSAVVRKRQGKQRLALQPFQSFLLQLAGRTELKTVQRIEETAPAAQFSGTTLYSALYMNELLCRLWPDNLASDHLFHLYQQSLAQLLAVQQGQAALEPCLRRFEFALLSELGLDIDWQYDASGAELSDEQCYQWQDEHGFVAAASGFAGKYLKAIGADNWQQAQTGRVAKQLSRQLLAALLGPKPLASRALFEQR